VKVGHKLKKFLSKHGSIKKKMHYKKIGPWGHWRDLIHVSNEVQNEKTDEVLLLDGTDDNKFFKAMRKATIGDAIATADLETLIADIKIIIKTSGWTKTQKHAKIHKKMKAFFKTRITLEISVNKQEVECLGIVESFRNVFKVKHRTTRVIKVISGSNNDDCELLKRLNLTASNESIEATQRGSIVQIHSVIKAKFEIEVDIMIRLQFVSQKIYDLLLQSPWVIQVLMDIKLEDNDPECGCDEGIR
jgi:hypothetical protein